MTHLEAAALMRALAPICKEHGIVKLRFGDIELEFAAQTGKVEEKLIARFNEMIDKGMPDEEAVLFHSSPDFVRPQSNAPEAPPKTTRGRRS